MLGLLRFMRPYRVLVVLVLGLTFTQTMASLYLPNLMSDIVDTGIIRGDVPYILGVGVLMFGITLLGGAAAVLASYCGARATAGFGQDLRLGLFSHVEHFTLQEFDQLGSSSLIVRTTNDVMQVQQLVNMMLRMLVMAPLTALGGIILAVQTDARLSLVLVVVLPVMGLAILLLMRQGLGLFRSMQAKVDRLNLVLRENLTGTRVIRAFGRGTYELGRFDAANADLTDTSVRVFQLMATTMPLVMLIMNLATVAIVWFGGVQINAGTLQLGQLMAFIQYVMQIMFAVLMVSMMLFMLPRGQASAVRIGEVLALEPRIVDHAELPAPSTSLRGQVEFSHVTFRYPGAEEPALSDISFVAAPGQSTAIIGGTGSGKSTLLHLLLRMYDAEAGRVLVDGVDVREMPQERLREKIGYVPQQTVLFSGTILDNIRYGNLEASAEDALRAAEVAQAGDFLAELGGGNLQAGLDAPLVQGGANLSGGQRQRLAIARALVRRAEIYVLDDSFSALDYGTDARLRAALRQHLGGATRIVVAQRVSSVRDAEQILVLDDGHLVGAGSHRELMESCPIYREIVSSQLSPEDVA